jgi:hypothetical protein
LDKERKERRRNGGKTGRKRERNRYIEKEKEERGWKKFCR